MEIEVFVSERVEVAVGDFGGVCGVEGCGGFKDVN